MMTDYLQEFGRYLQQEKRLSPGTVQSYLADVRGFLGFLAQEPATAVARVSREQIGAYMERLGALKRSASTVKRNMASIRCYYQYLVLIGVVQANPAKEVQVQNEEKKLPMILNGHEIDLLLRQPDSTWKGSRDKAMLELLYATGIRVSELIALNVEDLDLQSGILYCRGGRAERAVPVYRNAVRAVCDYVTRVRGMLLSPESGQALFVNLNGRRLTRQGFWKIVKAYAAQAGIEKEITPHTLRHSFALHLLENGAELKVIQEMMGHADIASTQVYVELLEDRHRRVYQQCHPGAREEREAGKERLNRSLG